MKISTAKNKDEVRMSVIVPWDDVKNEYEALLKKYGKIPVKGFRSGKVPQKTLETLFKKQLQADLANRCLVKLCRKAMRREGLESGSSLSIDGISASVGESFSFAAEFIEMPEFELPDYKNLGLLSENNEDLADEISKKLLERTELCLNEKIIEQELRFAGEDNERNAKQAAKDRAALFIILKRIAKLDGISVGEKDIEERVKNLAEQNGNSPEEVRELLIKEGGLPRLADILLAEQVLDYLAETNKEKAH